MPKKIIKSRIPQDKLKSQPVMTVHNKKDVIDSSSYFPEAATRKSPWPVIETISSSRDFNSRATSSSWPEEIEEAATRKVLNLWHAVERTLYKEDEQVPLGNVMEECIQWRTQIPHYRVVGKSMTLKFEDNDCETALNDESKNNCYVDKSADVTPTKDDAQSKILNTSSKNQHLVEQVIDRITEYIYGELEKDEDGELLNKDLDQVLRITPAPTYSGPKNGRSKKIIDKNYSNYRGSSANIFESFQLTERIKKINSTALSKTHKNAKDASYHSIISDDDSININGDINDAEKDNDDDDDDDVDDDDDDNDVEVVLASSGDKEMLTQRGRHKLGTVFNKKVVVSPVPYAVSTRESFCTLQTTPIRYAGHLLELSTPHGFGRSMNSASKLQSKHRKSPLRLPQRHSAWQAPVCPAVWPKNIRLAPIDRSRLPSSKNRLSQASASMPQRGRNSLSPILHPLKTTTGSGLNGDDFLEIQGQQITRSAKLHRIMSEWDHQNSDAERHNKKTNQNKTER